MRLGPLLFVLAACGGKTNEPLGGDASAEVGSETAPTDTAVDAPKDAGSDACFDASGLISVPFKICTNDSDCVAVAHQISCCGDQLWVGVAKGEKASVDACELVSRSKFPGCGCPMGPPKTEDGKTLDFSATPVVRCTDRAGSTGICKTSAT